MSRLVPAGAALAFLLSAPALAGRTLEEPKAVALALKSAPRATVQAALKEAELEDQCAAAALRSKELRGLRCRLAVFAHLEKKRAPRTPADVKARLRAAEAAFAAARTLSSYAPLTRPPRLDEERFEAHRGACGVLVAAWDSLRSLPKGANEATQQAAATALATPLEGGAPLGEAACSCTARSLELSSGGGASLELIGALQGTITSHGCFLDESKVKAQRGGPESRFSGAAARYSAESTDEAQLVTYAKTRDVSFNRCREKYLAPGHVKDKEGMQTCLCGELTRWRFPPKRERPEMDVRVPVRDDALLVVVKVSAPGQVTGCGPLEGALVR